jgi:drug/metabolite transporter (DMT)-like permease
VVAVLLGWAIAGERLDSRTISGAAVIVVAVVILVAFTNRTNRTAVRRTTSELAEARSE